MMIGERMHLLVAAIAALAVPVMAQAQAGDDPKAHVNAAVQGLKQSQAELAHYEWVETTIMSYKGEEKSRTQNRVYYGADGKEQKTPMGPPPEEKKARGVRGRVAENKGEDITEFMQKAGALIAKYVPPDPAKLQQMAGTGKMSSTPLDGGKRVRLDFHDYLAPGDLFSLEFDLANSRVQGLHIASYVEKPEDPVDLAVTFGTLADGKTVYAQAVVLDAKSRA
jgi:hypothetical protein